MNHQYAIILYRPRAEQQQDQFIQDNPEFVLGFLGVIVLIIVISVAMSFFKNINRRY
jgi:hypothetical protein